MASAFLDAIAQPRRFLVRQHPHAGQRAVGIDADQQLNRPAVAIRRERRGEQRHRLAVLARPIHRHRLVGSQPLRRHHFDGVLGDAVVVAIRRHQLVQAGFQRRALRLGDNVLGAGIGHGDQAGADHGEAGQDQGGDAHAAREGLHPRRAPNTRGWV